MADSRLTSAMIADLRHFIAATANTWRNTGLIKPNSYGVVVYLSPTPLGGFGNGEDAVHVFGETMVGAEHDMEWYAENAQGKVIASLAAGMDSHEAVRLYQGALADYNGIFPWGGAVYDAAYGLAIGTSGFKEDEDILFSRTVRNRAVMLLDRAGQAWLDEARARSQQEGTHADRFTRS